MSYDPEMDADLLLEKIMDSIEQSDNFNKSTTA
jgi:hypothetical protein